VADAEDLSLQAPLTGRERDAVTITQVTEELGAVNPIGHAGHGNDGRRILVGREELDSHRLETGPGRTTEAHVTLEGRIEAALDQARPYLGSHAGGVEYLGVDDDGVAHLKLEGSCHGCPSSTVTVKLTLEQAIIDHSPGIDPLSMRDLTYLRKRCEQHGIKVEREDGPGKLQIALFEKTAESALLDPTFVYAYPVEVSPLSRPNDADPFIADRFEFFLAGREIANGFSELTDPEEQAARFRAQAARKDQGDEEAMFYDADYVRALEYGMPPAAGLGVGIDRLVMFFTDSPSIRDVILFPHMRPETG